MLKKKAFTLIDLLIIIAVIFIIFSAMGINIRSLQNEAKISKVVADIKTLQIAVETYYKNFMYEFPPEENYQSVLLEMNPRVLETNLIDPFGKTSTSLYRYKLSQSNNYYVIYSVGLRRTGDPRINDNGTVVPEGSPIWVSNGHL